MEKIPKNVIKKFQQIQKHQEAVKRILAELDEKYPLLKEIADESGWDFAMHIDAQGAVSDADGSANLFIKWINGEVPLRKDHEYD